MTMSKWKMQERGDSIQVFPLGDKEKHLTLSYGDSIKCECKPIVDITHDTPIVIHNSFDCREAVEMAEEILSDE